MKPEVIDILRQQGVVFALVFGSEAKGNSNEKSDVDIAVYFDEKNKTTRLEKKAYLIGKLNSITEKDFDIVVFNDTKNNFLLADILKEGKILFSNDDDFSFKYLNDKIHQVHDFLAHIEYVNKKGAVTS